MRRMPTSKQINYINELNSFLSIDSDSKVHIVGSGVEYKDGSSTFFDFYRNGSDTGLRLGNDSLLYEHRDEHQFDIYNSNGSIYLISVKTIGQDQYIADIKLEEGNVIMPSLPTSDPEVEGALWNDNGVLKISAGE